jgi:hypothetical protein
MKKGEGRGGGTDRMVGSRMKTKWNTKREVTKQIVEQGGVRF